MRSIQLAVSCSTVLVLLLVACESRTIMADFERQPYYSSPLLDRPSKRNTCPTLDEMMFATMDRMCMDCKDNFIHPSLPQAEVHFQCKIAATFIQRQFSHYLPTVSRGLPYADSPEQRVISYEEWLQRILAVTPSDHPDLPNLKRAVCLLGEAALTAKEQVDSALCERQVQKIEELFPQENLQLLTRRSRASKVKDDMGRKKNSSRGEQAMVRSKVPLLTLPVLDPHELAAVMATPQRSRAKENFVRTYIKEGPVVLITGVQSQERYLFLFNDLLLVAKEKSQTSYKLKEKIRLCEVWLSAVGTEDVAESSLAGHQSFVLGWPTTNCVAKFGTQSDRDTWYQTLRELIAVEKDRERPKVTTVSVQLKNVKAEEPCKLLVNNQQSAADVVKMALFELDIPAEHASQYQLWVHSGKENAPYPLCGHEAPFAILLSHVRDMLPSGGSELSLEQLQDLANQKLNLRCHFVLRLRGAKKAKKRSPTSNFMDQIKRKMMVKSTSVDLAQTTSPTTGQLFSQPLSSLSPDENSVPAPVLEMLKYLFQDGLFCEGIFRKTPKATAVRDLRERLDSGESAVCLRDANPHVVASLLKEFLRSLPDSLLPADQFHAWLKIVSSTSANKAQASELIAALPQSHRELLRHLLCLLHHVCARHAQNHMNSSNVGICFGFSLLSSPTDMTVSEGSKCVPEVTQYLIDHAVELFGSSVTTLLGAPPDKPHNVDSGEGEDSDSIGLLKQEASSMDSLVGPSPLTGRALQSARTHTNNLSRDSGLADDSEGLSLAIRSFSQSDETEEETSTYQFSRQKRVLRQQHSDSTVQGSSEKRLDAADHLAVTTLNGDHTPSVAFRPENSLTASAASKTVSLDRRAIHLDQAARWSYDSLRNASADSLYHSQESTASSSGKSNSPDHGVERTDSPAQQLEPDVTRMPLRNSRRAHVGMLQRSASGEHLLIKGVDVDHADGASEPAKTNSTAANERLFPRLSVPIDPSDDADSLSQASSAFPSTSTSPTPTSRSGLSSGPVSPESPAGADWIRNAPARRPARHHKGPAPTPPKAAQEDNVDGPPAEHTEECSLLADSITYVAIPSPKRFTAADPVPASRLLLPCNASTDDPTTENSSCSEHVETDAGESDASSCRSSSLSEHMDDVIEVISVPKGVLTGHGNLPFRITVPETGTYATKMQNATNHSALLRGTAQYTPRKLMTSTATEVPPTFEGALAAEEFPVHVVDTVNESSTITESSDESTPHVSRESSRAQDFETKASVMFPRRETPGAEVNDKQSPTLQKLYKSYSTADAAAHISSTLAAVQYRHRQLPPVLHRMPALKIDYHANHASSEATTPIPDDPVETSKLAAVTQTQYIVRGTPLAVKPRPPSYEQTMRVKHERDTPAVALQRPRSFREVRTNCDYDCNTPDVYEASCSEKSNSPVPGAQSQEYKLQIPVTPGQVKRQIRRYDRETRRRTVGGHELKSLVAAAKSHHAVSPATALSQPYPLQPATSCDRVNATVAASGIARSATIEPISRRSMPPVLLSNDEISGDDDGNAAEISWSVRRLRELYDPNRTRTSPTVISSDKLPWVKENTGRPLTSVQRPSAAEQVRVSDAHSNYPVVKPPPLNTSNAQGRGAGSRLQLTTRDMVKDPSPTTVIPKPTSYVSHKYFDSSDITTRRPQATTNALPRTSPGTPGTRRPAKPEGSISYV